MTQQEVNEEISILKKKMLYFLYGAILTLIVLLFVQKCTPEPSIGKVTITTKEVKGKFSAVKPVHDKISTTAIGQNLSKNDKSKNDKSKNDKNKRIEQYENSEQFFLKKKIDSLLVINKKIENDFANMPDSAKIYEYKKAIQLNKFSQTFDDKNITIDVSGVSRGTVENIKADYTIKPQKQEVPIKQRVFALKTGFEYGNTTTLTNSVFKGNIEVENKKGNSFGVSYDTDGRYWIRYSKTVFEIKR